MSILPTQAAPTAAVDLLSTEAAEIVNAAMLAPTEPAVRAALRELTPVAALLTTVQLGPVLSGLLVQRPDWDAVVEAYARWQDARDRHLGSAGRLAAEYATAVRDAAGAR